VSTLSLRAAGEAISLTKDALRAIGPFDSVGWGKFLKEVEERGDDGIHVTCGNLEGNRSDKVFDRRCLVSSFRGCDADDEIRDGRMLNDKELTKAEFEEVP